MAAFALDRRHDRPVGEINVTPLVDVLLVLLIIFMVAAPIATQRLRLDLPNGRPDSTPSHEPVNLSVKQTGELYWNGVAISRGVLARQLAQLAHESDPPALAIRAEPATKYQYVADVLAAARDADLQRISVESH